MGKSIMRRSTGNTKLFSGIKNFFKLTILLIVLGEVIQVTGTIFFGVDWLSIIITVIVFAIIIAGLQRDKRTIVWIEKKLNKLFR